MNFRRSKSIYVFEFILALLGFSLLRLWRHGSLNAYIHPSTIWMVVVSSVLLIGFSLYLVTQSKWHFHATKIQVFTMAAIVLVLAFGKVAPLSAAAVRQRQTESSNPLASRQVPKLGKLSAQFSVLEWYVAWENNPDHSRYINNPADVTGFIYVSENKTYVSRMVITCCVVDAAPVNLELLGDKPFPKENSWVHVIGKMADKDGKPAVKVESLTPIDQPTDVYIH